MVVGVPAHGSLCVPHDSYGLFYFFLVVQCFCLSLAIIFLCATHAFPLILVIVCGCWLALFMVLYAPLMIFLVFDCPWQWFFEGAPYVFWVFLLFWLSLLMDSRCVPHDLFYGFKYAVYPIDTKGNSVYIKLVCLLVLLTFNIQKTQFRWCKIDYF